MTRAFVTKCANFLVVHHRSDVEGIEVGPRSSSLSERFEMCIFIRLCYGRAQNVYILQLLLCNLLRKSNEPHCNLSVMPDGVATPSVLMVFGLKAGSTMLCHAQLSAPAQRKFPQDIC